MNVQLSARLPCLPFPCLGPQVLSFPITIWPMREDIIEMLAHSFGSSTQLSPTAYYLLTYTSLLAIYLVAVVIQSAYSVGWFFPLSS